MAESNSTRLEDEPESEVLRHRVEGSVTHLLGVRDTLKLIAANLPDDEDVTCDIYHALRLLADDVEREADLAGTVERFPRPSQQGGGVMAKVRPMKPVDRVARG